jgi:molybdenum cofactor biosynthesis enzyme
MAIAPRTPPPRDHSETIASDFKVILRELKRKIPAARTINAATHPHPKKIGISMVSEDIEANTINKGNPISTAARWAAIQAQMNASNLTELR